MAIREDRKGGCHSLPGLGDILLRINREMGIDKPRAEWHAFGKGGITIAHKEGMSAKAINMYIGITEEIVYRNIQLDRREVTEMFTEAHPFFDKGKAFKEEAEAKNPIAPL